MVRPKKFSTMRPTKLMCPKKWKYSFLPRGSVFLSCMCVQNQKWSYVCVQLDGVLFNQTIVWFNSQIGENNQKKFPPQVFGDWGMSFDINQKFDNIWKIFLFWWGTYTIRVRIFNPSGWGKIPIFWGNLGLPQFPSPQQKNPPRSNFLPMCELYSWTAISFGDFFFSNIPQIFPRYSFNIVPMDLQLILSIKCLYVYNVYI